MQAFSGRICDWLAAHTNDEGVAHHLYSMWLERGGEPVLIRESLMEWLAGNTVAERASFIYSAWLDAGGDPELVREPIRDWLTDHPAKTGPAHAKRSTTTSRKG